MPNDNAEIVRHFWRFWAAGQSWREYTDTARVKAFVRLISHKAHEM